MGIFDAFRKKDANVVTPVATTGDMPISSFSQTSQKVNLIKSKEDLGKAISLTKEKTGVDLASVKARVAVVMDISGSMRRQYENGNVQDMLTRLLPFALQFDDNGELEVYLFSDNCQRVKTPMTEKNFECYVRSYIIGKYSYGGTKYAPAITMTDDDYDDKDSHKIPTLVFFITDGANSDQRATDEAIIQSSKNGIFYEFIGIGASQFEYLEKLDDLSGRECDNTGFMTVEDFQNADNVQVFTDSLKDYLPWLRVKGYIH